MKTKTTKEILQAALLMGKSITKFDFMNLTPQSSVCIAQRVKELRKDGWLILTRTVKGKGGLVEYYLPDDEIVRLRNELHQA